MKRVTKTKMFVCLKLIEAYLLYCLYQRHKVEVTKSYNKGIEDCVDNFVKGFVFTNNKVVTVESKHNGSVTVRTIG